MKKIITGILATTMVLSLAACGGNKATNSGTEETTTSQGSESGETSTSQETIEEIKPAVDGEITLSSANIAVVVNGKKVSMPYNLVELETAGVPVDETLKEEELASGNSFSVNLYLDENGEYLLIPDYYNQGDDTVALTDAEAKTITMSSYASEPTDQGVSLLGVTYGMTKSDVKAMLGEPMNDYDTYCEWQIAVTDADFVGNLSIYFSDSTDEAGACEIRLDFMEW